MQITFLTLTIAAIAVMLYALFRVVQLRRQVPGGVVRYTWNYLTCLVVLFTLGYLATPFFPLLPEAARQLLVGVIFLGGAVFVVVVVNLFQRIVSELGL
jgi:hypothetical protein